MQTEPTDNQHTFIGILEKHSIAAPKMPLMHSTSINRLRGVLASRTLSLAPCPVFKEDLLYFFYGRPAYWVFSNHNARTDLKYCPICFLLKPHALAVAKRIYPFDTGAFAKGMFTAHISGESLDGYCLGTSLEMPQRLVDVFFGSNRSYYFGHVRRDFSASVLDLEVNSYYQLISSTGESFSDDRKYSIEIQSTGILELNEDTVLAVVLPQVGLDDPEILAQINAWKATPIAYNTFRGTAPSLYHGVIREYVGRFLEAEGYL